MRIIRERHRLVHYKSQETNFISRPPRLSLFATERLTAYVMIFAIQVFREILRDE